MENEWVEASTLTAVKKNKIEPDLLFYVVR